MIFVLTITETRITNHYYIENQWANKYIYYGDKKM